MSFNKKEFNICLVCCEIRINPSEPDLYKSLDTMRTECLLCTNYFYSAFKIYLCIIESFFQSIYWSISWSCLFNYWSKYLYTDNQSILFLSGWLFVCLSSINVRTAEPICPISLWMSLTWNTVSSFIML